MTKPATPSPDSTVLTDKGGFFDRLDIEFLIHELKDPLSVIETAVRMLLEKPEKLGPLTDRQAKTLKRALKGSQKARRLISDLLEVGRSDAGCFHCQPFDAVAVLGEVLMEALETTDRDLWETLQTAESDADRRALLSRNGIDFRCTVKAGELRLCQDETKFRQIAGNLIKNALQHRVRCLEIGLACQNEQLVVDVIDDGPGIEHKHRELIFQRYTRLGACATTSRPGHGLGLAGARILARHLGGDITVRNNHGSGAVFCLVLPMTLEV
jgi:signal transduction histidine kinase